MRRLFWFLVVLALLAVGADRGGDYAAEQVVASSLQTSAELDTKPDVDITGIPFLTQFANNAYPKVVVTVSDLSVKKTDLKIDRVRLTFRDVTANRDFTTFDAKSGTAAATVGFGTIRDALGAKVSYAANDRVRVDRTATVLGKDVPVAITAKPTITDGVLVLSDPQLAEKLPSGVSIDLDQAVRVRIPVTGLPFDLRATGVSTSAAGVRLTLAGTDLHYTR